MFHEVTLEPANTEQRSHLRCPKKFYDENPIPTTEALNLYTKNSSEYFCFLFGDHQIFCTFLLIFFCEKNNDW